MRLADFEAAAESHPGSVGRMERLSVYLQSSTLRRLPDPAGRLDRDPQPRPFDYAPRR